MEVIDMRKMLIALLLLVAVVSACARTATEDSVNEGFCTKDAKVCPDGSTVGREGPDCEFAPCPGESDDPMPVEPDGGIGTTNDTPIPVEPDGGIGDTPSDDPMPVEPDGGIGLTDPYTKYVSTDVEECKLILFQCIEGASAFSDSTGCGCRADEPKRYVSRDPDECSRIRYACDRNYVPFSDEDGCGCEYTFEE